MSTEVLGTFESVEAATSAADALLIDGFSIEDIRLETKYHGLADGQALVSVVTADNVAEDKALRQLRMSGALKIDEISKRYTETDDL